MVVLVLFARALVILPLSTISITTDLIVTLLCATRDIFIEPALPIWPPGGSTNSVFCNVESGRFTFMVFVWVLSKGKKNTTNDAQVCNLLSTRCMVSFSNSSKYEGRW